MKKTAGLYVLIMIVACAALKGLEIVLERPEPFPLESYVAIVGMVLIFAYLTLTVLINQRAYREWHEQEDALDQKALQYMSTEAHVILKLMQGDFTPQEMAESRSESMDIIDGKIEQVFTSLEVDNFADAVAKGESLGILRVKQS